MAEPSELTQHIESYVDTSRSQTQQAASLDSITSLVKNDLITIETLVKEMEMYLTTTDNVIRARGTVLLAEVLGNLVLKPLDKVTIHSLIGFFTDRLADWRALRGALVGCLALLRRKSDAGIVSATDAKAVAESYLKNLEVQSLGQHDRKLCFQLLECLIERYPNEVASLDELLLYGICEAVDGEKDPYCLMLAFHVIQVLVQLFPDPSGPLANFSGELFETLESYFPIHFTHPEGEDSDVKRDDLSRALMIAFSSTPLLEPSVIPLLLEKLSSSLPSAKVDSLKYLSYCSLKYGADRMAKHAKAIWSSIKTAISTSLKEPTKSITSESMDGLGFLENEITAEALVLLEIVVLQNNDLYLSLILDDEDIRTIFNIITSYVSYKDFSLQGKQRLHVVGRILYITSRTSVVSCNRMLETFFSRLVDVLKLSMRNSSRECVINFGALYLCMELFTAARDLIIGSNSSISADEACFCILQSSSDSLINALCSKLAITAKEVAHDVDVYFRVKSLQILAIFPEDHLPISKSAFENCLTILMSIILVDFNKTLLWKLALKALYHIGSFVSKCHESDKALSYTSIVVEKIVSSLLDDNFTLPLPLKLEAVSAIGASGMNHVLKIVQGLQGAIFASISDSFVHGSIRSAEMAIQLLQFYSEKVIPWIKETDGLEEVLLHFAVNIWGHVESWIFHDDQVYEKGLLDATMMAMKLTVASCSGEIQNAIIQKAYTVLSSNTSLLLKESSLTSIPIRLEGLQLTERANSFSGKDELVLSLFASVIIAVQPKIEIPNVKEILRLFLTTLLKGHVPSAQALGSMINKFGTKSNRADISYGFMLEEAIDIIFETKSWNSQDNGVLSSDDNEMGLTDLCLGFVDDRQLQINSIVGLAWVAKGLLLCGHEKVKDVIMILLECLLPGGSIRASKSKPGLSERISEKDLHPSVKKSAADAFHLLMSDSEVCLNRKFHAIIRPLYKQRLFSVVMPILQSSIRNSNSSFSRSLLYRASAHIISDAPLIAVLSEAKKLISILLEGLSIFNEDPLDKEKLYNLLLVLSGILTEKNGQEAVIENAHSVINCLTGLMVYRHMMLVRETAIQCLVAMSELPHARIYPMRTQVLRAILKAVDDPKRAVRQEAVRCRKAWASLASRGLHF
ncbi:Coatomer beta subunit [Parasponia andersonii]|uniref:MMS19 nucleotide excision repair protein n=1 Tax=Parasponia andersonii TaxID=3476 RepID=A0A2P5C021_PARAD|nr:Coatomer beta subunit [Parasponia andersonii]